MSYNYLEEKGGGFTEISEETGGEARETVKVSSSRVLENGHKILIVETREDRRT